MGLHWKQIMSRQVEILCFTDPFCSWCWATEPALLTLRERYRDQIDIQFVQGGLIKDMTEFYDQTNEIRTPAEVVPHWRMVSERSRQPIDERFWLEVDPHVSTWPACLATKAAGLQGKAVGDRYLRRLRRAVLTERAQINKESELLRLAREVQGLDSERFQVDLNGPEAARAFQEDLELCAAYGASGFPTMLFRSAGTAADDPDHPAILVGGHRTLATYETVLTRIAPALTPHEPRPVETLLAEHGPLTSRELSEIYGKAIEDLEAELYGQGDESQAMPINLRGGTLWILREGLQHPEGGFSGNVV